jgi:rhodanese-related sulfurtransferase
MVDIRDQESFKNSKIISSLNFSKKNEIMDLFLQNKNKEVVLICNTGKISAEFVRSLLNTDDSIKIRYLIGGINKWKAEKLPIETN